MNQKLKQDIFNFIRDNFKIKKEEKTIKVEVDPGVTKDGLYYDKEKAFKYMSDNYIEFTDDNLEYVAKKFLINLNEDNKMVKEEKITLESDLLDSLDDKDIQTYIDFNLLKEIVKLNKGRTKQYKIETVMDDLHGSVNIRSISKIINEYSSEGWSLAHIFSNELGKESTYAGIGGVGGGVNATIDEVILIFEKYA